MEYSKILYTEDEIIGYAWDIADAMKKEINNILESYYKGELDSDEMNEEIDYYSEIVKELANAGNDYELIRISNHPMGGAIIERLERI